MPLGRALEMMCEACPAAFKWAADDEGPKSAGSGAFFFTSRNSYRVSNLESCCRA